MVKLIFIKFNINIFNLKHIYFLIIIIGILILRPCRSQNLSKFYFYIDFQYNVILKYLTQLHMIFWLTHHLIINFYYFVFYFIFIILYYIIFFLENLSFDGAIWEIYGFQNPTL